MRADIAAAQVRVDQNVDHSRQLTDMRADMAKLRDVTQVRTEAFGRVTVD